MFKNITIYRTEIPWSLSRDRMEAALQTRPFTPCGQLETESVGWAPPREGGALIHAVQGQWLLALASETKILPQSVINRVAAERARELEAQQGFRPGRKQLRELKETIADELLPRALSRHAALHVWIDPARGWLVIDSASPAKVDNVLRMLLKSTGNVPLLPLRTRMTPQTMMTQWLAADAAPAGFTIDNDCELQSMTMAKGTVRFKNQMLDPEDVRRHIDAGKQCTKLAMTWNDRVSFRLDANLVLRSVRPLDVLTESPTAVANDDERFDAELLLMADEFDKLLTGLIDVLGGEVDTLEQQQAA